jgi:hypothetical protein
MGYKSAGWKGGAHWAMYQTFQEVVGIGWDGGVWWESKTRLRVVE